MWARQDQIWKPGDEKYTFYMCGRGWGKTMCGQGAINETAEHRAEMVGGEMALIGKTPKAIRDDMVEGPAGILKNAKPWFKPKWYPSQRRLVYPNGVVCHTYSAHNPAEMRGPQVGFLWADELAHWKYPRRSWEEGVEMFLRHGRNPKGIITTTPTPHELIVELAKDPDVRIVNGNTADNLGNLAADYLTRVYNRFAGTDLAEQELGGKILLENKKALWKHSHIGYTSPEHVPGLFRTVIAIDPAGGTSEDTSDESGIVACAIDNADLGYVLEDVSGNYSASDWAGRAIDLGHMLGADAIVAEKNFGGDMVETTIRQHPKWRGEMDIQIVTATKSKGHRAAPVAAKYQQRQIFHVADDPSEFAELERQMTKFDPTVPRRSQGWSPDRMDAMVWGFIALYGDGRDTTTLRADGASGLDRMFEDLEQDDSESSSIFDGL